MSFLKSHVTISSSDADLILSVLVPVVIVIIIVSIIVGIKASKTVANENARIYGCGELGPLKTEQAKVISKRVSISNNQYVPNVHYVTFQFSDGSRKEFALKDSGKYGLLVENDEGILKYRNNQFIDFVRNSWFIEGKGSLWKK